MSNPVKVKKMEQVKLERLQALAAYQAQLLAANNIVGYNETQEHPAFELACEKFRAVCAKVGENFHGSYEEIEAVQNTISNELKWELMYCNQLCIHEGNKIGLPPPQWFFKCWGMTGNN